MKVKFLAAIKIFVMGLSCGIEPAECHCGMCLSRAYRNIELLWLTAVIF